MDGAVDEGRFSITPIGPGDAPALIALMERDGGSCFCRYWHFTGTNKEWEARCGLDAKSNEAELRVAVAERRDDGRGLVARIPGEPERVVGWMKLAPRRTLTKLLARVPYRGLDDATTPLADTPADTLAIACFVVDPTLRRRGIARALVEGAIRLAPSWGASFVEAYPRVSEQPLHDGEAWMGPHRLFAELGFEIARESPQYPVLRRRL
ncbi:MAG: GNAT family N-acetyltransferase [Polyangiales bacterium]